jgi:hypothetical protein
MRVEIGEHAAHGRFDQFLVRDFLDIVRSDSLEDIAEEFQETIGLGPIILLCTGGTG